MKITRTSMFTGIVREMDLPVTEEQMALFESGGALIQVAFPHLSVAEREFILTGVTQEEWDRFMFREEDDGPDTEDDDGLGYN